jgi:3-dehydroquinate synthase
MPAQNERVAVQVPGASYEVIVASGLLADAAANLAPLVRAGKAIVVSDTNVAPKHANPLLTSLQATGFEALLVTVPAGEQHKTLDTVSTIYDQVLSAKIERATPIIALGGGVIGDMAGFVAATVLRGVPFVQVPTTLLSMVDASVGGKTGIDHAAGKNLIGAFHQPIAVLIDPTVLRTLPPRELRSGLAECIKHEIIRDREGFAALEQNIPRAMALDVEYLTTLIAHNVAIKARVVEADPFERGERAHLNFGHTFGHAIETVSNYEYAHGECVALGMVAASRLAQRLGMLDGESVARITKLIGAAGLPTGAMKLRTDDVVDAMFFDKKVKGGRLRFVLPDAIGHVVIRDNVPIERVREAVDSLQF